jgi:WD40 repeat protein
VSLIGILTVLVRTSRDPQIGAEAIDHPFAQMALENLHGLVWSLAFASDGTQLAAATVTGDVWLKDLTDGRLLHLQRGLWMSAQSLAFASGAHVRAVAGHDPAVRLWDLDRDAEPLTLETAQRFAKSVVFAPGGELLAVSEGDGSGGGAVVTLWNRRNQRRLATLEGHYGRVTSSLRHLRSSPVKFSTRLKAKTRR